MPSSPSTLSFLALLLILALAPFDEGAGRDLTPATIVTIAAIALGTALLRRRVSRARALAPVRSPALLPAVALVALAAASAAWSIDRFVSLVALARYAACAVVLLAVLDALRSADWARRLATAVIVIACLFAGLGVWQAAFRAGRFPADDGARAHAVFVTPNTFAGFLIIALPMALALAWTARTALRRIAFCAAALLLIEALVLSRSQGGCLAGFAALCFLAWQLLATGRRRPRVRPVVAVGLFAALLAAALGVLWASPNLRARLFAPLPAHKAASAEDRFTYWTTALEMAGEALPLGLGADTYHLAYPAHQRPSQAGWREWYAHNDYLQILAELGPLGLILLLWLLGTILRLGDAVLVKSSDPADRALVAGCLAGAGAALLQSLIDYNLYVPGTAIPIFLCFGIIAAAHARTVLGVSPVSCGRGTGVSPVVKESEFKHGRDARPTAGAARPDTGTPHEGSIDSPRRVLAALLLGAGTIAALLAVTPWAGQQLATASRLHANRARTVARGSAAWCEQMAASLENAELAVAVCPAAPGYWAYLAGAQAVTDPVSARASYERAIRLSPRAAEFHARLGDLLHENRELFATAPGEDPGLMHLREARSLDPLSARFRLWLARACLESGRAGEAVTQLEFCVRRCRPTPEQRKSAEDLLRR